MSLHPPKHNEKNKWPNKRSGKKKRVYLDYNLIVSEGTKTEPYYFNALKARINSKESNRVQVDIKGTGLNTIGLLEYAKKLVANNANGYRHVWLVYDKDDFPEDHFNQMVEACKTINKDSETEYHAIWSNQCMELWFLLHYSFFQSDLHRSEYYPKLSAVFEKSGEYKKNREDIFDLLYPKLGDAIMNAERLEEENRGRTPSESAPGTMMHIMMKKFKPYL